MKDDKTNKEKKEKIIFDKKTFFENLIFFVDVVYNKTNDTENYKNLILEYGGQVQKFNYWFKFEELINSFNISFFLFEFF